MYSENDWRNYKEFNNVRLRHAEETEVSIVGKKLYFPNGIPRDFVIRKGEPMDAVLAITEDDKDENYLEHHDIQGQKWGVRNGPPYPLKECRSDFTLKKGSKITRYSDREEKEVRRNAYASYRKNDVNQYVIDLGLGDLGPKNVKEIYTMKIRAKEDIKIRSGRSTVKDVVDAIGSKKVKDAFDVLDEKGYFSDKSDAITKYEIWRENDKTKDARNTLGGAIHDYIYKDRSAFSETYRKQGYGAIVDPEDVVWNYEQPIIITDESKFEISDVSHQKNRYSKEN